MEQIFKKKLADAIKTLDNLQKRDLVSFKVFVGDEEYGDLEVVQTSKRTRAASAHPFGAVRNHVLPYLDSLEPDGIVSIPFGEFEPEALRGNACAWATTRWGKGSYSTTVNRDKQTVEVYRHEE